MATNYTIVQKNDNPDQTLIEKSVEVPATIEKTVFSIGQLKERLEMTNRDIEMIGNEKQWAEDRIAELQIKQKQIIQELQDVEKVVVSNNSVAPL